MVSFYESDKKIFGNVTLSINNLKNSIQGSPEATFYSHFLGFCCEF